MNVIAFRPREFAEAKTRAAELPHRREFANPADTRIGSPLGRAAIRGLITEEEFTAGVAWGAVHSEYIETIKNPDDHTDARCEHAAQKYQMGMKILAGHPKRVMHAVMALAAYGEDWGDLKYTAEMAAIGLRDLPQRY